MINKTELELFTKYFNSNRSEVSAVNRGNITHADLENFKVWKEIEVLE